MITKEVQNIIGYKRSVLNHKWGIECIITLGDGEPLRFNEIQDNLPGCSAKVLAHVLKKLEAQNHVFRVSYNEMPPRVTYKLSDSGLLLFQYLENSIEFFREAYKLYTDKIV
jgi:DNA-binding HxlR family transcriptional regulator